ncbi:hypothetical protein M378DRAFT_579252 [Amanita muscaria Koide BX008]|uniref:Uncharacterized protein n=1 Tax=Amanita muscaria (strain Koide BX008) TaxID=946122 RepID=A0A0C2WSD5_AMAMK|nr:hypothetical protein M378DRAFT_579252 [Amanita muscaria Koide BX008]
MKRHIKGRLSKSVIPPLLSSKNASTHLCGGVYLMATWDHYWEYVPSSRIYWKYSHCQIVVRWTHGEGVLTLLFQKFNRLSVCLKPASLMLTFVAVF